MYHFLQLTRATIIIAKYLLHTDFNVICNNAIIDSTMNIVSKIRFEQSSSFPKINVGTIHLVSLIFLQCERTISNIRLYVHTLLTIYKRNAFLLRLFTSAMSFSEYKEFNLDIVAFLTNS